MIIFEVIRMASKYFRLVSVSNIFYTMYLVSPDFSKLLKEYLASLYRGRIPITDLVSQSQFNKYLLNFIISNSDCIESKLVEDLIKISCSNSITSERNIFSLICPSGDVHGGPSCTSSITISGQEYYLKSRSSNIEIFWNSLNDLLGLPFHSPTPFFTSFDNTSFLQLGFKSANLRGIDLDLFFVRLGSLYALLVLFGFTDAHKENFLVSDNSISLVDPETLFSSFAYKQSHEKSDSSFNPSLEFIDHTEFLYVNKFGQEFDPSESSNQFFSSTLFQLFQERGLIPVDSSHLFLKGVSQVINLVKSNFESIINLFKYTSPSDVRILIRSTRIYEFFLADFFYSSFFNGSLVAGFSLNRILKETLRKSSFLFYPPVVINSLVEFESLNICSGLVPRVTLDQIFSPEYSIDFQSFLISNLTSRLQPNYIDCMINNARISVERLCFYNYHAHLPNTKAF